MKKIKKIFVLSDGSCFFDYSVITSIKFSNVNFQKNDYKNSKLYNDDKINKNLSSHTKHYIKKYFS